MMKAKVLEVYQREDHFSEVCDCTIPEGWVASIRGTRGEVFDRSLMLDVTATEREAKAEALHEVAAMNRNHQNYR